MVQGGGLPRSASEACNGLGELLEDLLAIVVVVGGGAEDTAADVVVQHQQTCLTGGSHDRRELRQHVDTVLISFDHPLHAPDLPLHPTQTSQDFRLVVGIGGRAPRGRRSLGTYLFNALMLTLHAIDNTPQG